MVLAPAACHECRPSTFGVFLCPDCVERARQARAEELAAARAPEPPAPGPEPETIPGKFKPAPLPERAAAFRQLVAESRPELELTDEQWLEAVRRLERALGGLYVPEQPYRIRAALRWVRMTSRVRPDPVPELADDLAAAGVTIPGGTWSVPAMTTAADATDPGRFVTGIDVNAMWPNAAQMVKLGTGRPDLVDTPGSDLFKLPGFFLIDHDPTWPAPFRDMPPGRWLPSPLAQLLAERLQEPPRARRGLVWREHRQWLRPFAQTALRARQDLLEPDPVSMAALAYLKTVANPAVDGFLRTTENRTPWRRPDWAEQVRALAAANMWRHLYRAPRLPTAQATDAAYYVVATPGERPAIPDPASGPVYSTQPGRFKIHRTVTYTDDMRAAAADGRAAQFQTLVTRAAGAA